MLIFFRSLLGLSMDSKPLPVGKVFSQDRRLILALFQQRLRSFESKPKPGNVW